MTDTIVIAGAGHAAGQAVASLKQRKFTGQIVLVGDEPYLPYQRPPLSKKYLSGDMPAERLYVKPESFYDDPQIDVRLSSSVVAVHRDEKRLDTSDGSVIAYDKLVLALGSRVRRLTIDGSDLPGIHYLRDIADVQRIRSDIETKKNIVIVGAGYIGLEVAAVLRQQGLDVTVVEMADRVMSRVVSPQISDFYQFEHVQHGVKLRLSTGIVAFHGKKNVDSVETADGERIRADVVIVGVGVTPNSELAMQAGIDIDNGIVVDDRCRTSDPDIYAIGDCSNHPNAIYDCRLRLESVQNALEQAKIAVANILGDDVGYSQVPWFWSDQYDLKLQIAGLSTGFDQTIIRGNPADRSFACLYLRRDRLIATDAVNAPKEFMQSKALIAARIRLDHDRLANSDIELKDNLI